MIVVQGDGQKNGRLFGMLLGTPHDCSYQRLLTALLYHRTHPRNLCTSMVDKQWVSWYIERDRI